MVFGIPDYRNGTDPDEKDFSIHSWNTISGSYDGEVYDASRENIAKAVMLYDIPGKITYSGQVALIAVKNVSMVIGDDGEQTKKVVGVTGTSERGFISRNESMFADVRRGDILQIRMDAERRQVLSVRVAYRDVDVDLGLYNGPDIPNPSTEAELDASRKYITYKNTFVKRAIWNYPNVNTVISGDLTNSTLLHGHVLRAESDYITIAYPYETRDTAAVAVNGVVVRSYPFNANVKIFKYRNGGNALAVSSSSKGQLISGSSDAAMNGSEVLINTAGGRVDEVWIFER
jgi:hypothetical protein